MRKFILLGIGLVWLLLPVMSVAGVYNSCEQYDAVIDSNGIFTNDFAKFDRTLTEIKRVQNDTDKFYVPLRERAMLVISLYEKSKTAKQGNGLGFGRQPLPGPTKKLDEEIRLMDLSAYYLRLGRLDRTRKPVDLIKAENLLPRLKLGSNFLLYSNLGTINQTQGKANQAATMLGLARSFWPSDYDALKKNPQDPAWKLVDRLGWNKRQFDWYRRADFFQFQLALLQAREQENNSSDDGPYQLFVKDKKPVEFVGPDGTFQPGTLKKSEKDKLPPDAVPIVQQLLLWLPGESRLEFLLAELLNARGDVQEAYSLLKVYHQKLKGGLPKSMLSRFRKLETHIAEEKAKAEQALTQGLEDDLNKKGKVIEPPPPILPNWQTFVVGFGTGCVFALLGYWQVRVFTRPRR